MNKIHKLVLGTTLLGLVITVGLIYSSSVKANPSRFVHNRTAAATSTLTQIFPGATSTLTFLTGGADRADMLLNVRASSSLASLKWTYEYSSNNVDWYGEDFILSQTNTNTLHASATPIHLWVPTAWTAVGTSSSSTSKSVLNIPVSNAEYMRINFIPLTATTSIWADVITKVQETY